MRRIQVNGGVEVVHSSVSDALAEQIATLRDHACKAGDLAQAQLCRRALLDGDAAAIRACERVLQETRAMVDES